MNGQMINPEDAAALRDQLDKFEKMLATLVCQRPVVYADSEGNILPQFLDFPPRPCPHCKALAMVADERLSALSRSASLLLTAWTGFPSTRSRTLR